MDARSLSLVGSRRRPTSGHIEPIGAFDSSVLPGIQTQPDTSTDIRNLVRIEGVRGSKSPQLHRVLAVQVVCSSYWSAQLGISAGIIVALAEQIS